MCVNEIGDITMIWEVNVYWALDAQCGVCDADSCRVDVWKCILAGMHHFLL